MADDFDFRISAPRVAGTPGLPSDMLSAERVTKDVTSAVGKGRIGRDIGDIMRAAEIEQAALKQIAEARAKFNADAAAELQGISAKESELLAVKARANSLADERGTIEADRLSKLSKIDADEAIINAREADGQKVAAERVGLQRQRNAIQKEYAVKVAEVDAIERRALSVESERLALSKQRAATQERIASANAQYTAAEAQAARVGKFGRIAAGAGTALLAAQIGAPIVGAVGEGLSGIANSINRNELPDFRKLLDDIPIFGDALKAQRTLVDGINDVAAAALRKIGLTDPADFIDRGRARAVEEARQQAINAILRDSNQRSAVARTQADSLRSANDARAAGGFEGQRIQSRAKETEAIANLSAERKALDERYQLDRKNIENARATKAQLLALQESYSKQAAAINDKVTEVERQGQKERDDIAKAELRARQDAATEAINSERNAQAAILAARGQAAAAERAQIDSDSRSRVQAIMTAAEREISDAGNNEEKKSDIRRRANADIVQIEADHITAMKAWVDRRKAIRDQEIESIRQAERAGSDAIRTGETAAAEATIASWRAAGKVLQADLASIDRAANDRIDQIKQNTEDRVREITKQADDQAKQADGEIDAPDRIRRIRQAQADAVAGVRSGADQTIDATRRQAETDKTVAREENRKRSDDRAMAVQREMAALVDRQLARQESLGGERVKIAREELRILLDYDAKRAEIEQKLRDKTLTEGQRSDLERVKSGLGDEAKREITTRRMVAQFDALRSAGPYAASDTTSYSAAANIAQRGSFEADIRRQEQEVAKRQANDVGDIKRLFDRVVRILESGGSSETIDSYLK